MKTDKEWAIRFAWLMGEAAFKAGVDAWPDRAERAALQLGREMAAERNADIGARLDDAMALNERLLTVALPRAIEEAADARAKEIARKLDKLAYTASAEIARSTITKPKEPEYASGFDLARDNDATVFTVRFTPEAEAAIRADEREKVAQRIEACEGQWNNILGEPVMCVATAAAVARAGEPKTREQAMEQALREIERGYGNPAKDIARRVLETWP